MLQILSGWQVAKEAQQLEAAQPSHSLPHLAAELFTEAVPGPGHAWSRKPIPGSTLCTLHILYRVHFFGSHRCFLVVHVSAMGGPVIVENWPTSYSLYQTSPKGTWSTTITCPGQEKKASLASCLFTGTICDIVEVWVKATSVVHNFIKKAARQQLERQRDGSFKSLSWTEKMFVSVL